MPLFRYREGKTFVQLSIFIHFEALRSFLRTPEDFNNIKRCDVPHKYHKAAVLQTFEERRKVSDAVNFSCFAAIWLKQKIQHLTLIIPGKMWFLLQNIIICRQWGFKRHLPSYHFWSTANSSSVLQNWLWFAFFSTNLLMSIVPTLKAPK